MVKIGLKLTNLQSNVDFTAFSYATSQFTPYTLKCLRPVLVLRLMSLGRKKHLRTLKATLKEEFRKVVFDCIRSSE